MEDKYQKILESKKIIREIEIQPMWNSSELGQGLRRPNRLDSDSPSPTRRIRIFQSQFLLGLGAAPTL